MADWYKGIESQIPITDVTKNIHFHEPVPDSSSSSFLTGNSGGFGSWGSSTSSFLSGGTPFGTSENDSTETDSGCEEDDHEFIAELTRRMADYMLQEEEQEGNLDHHDAADGQNHVLPKGFPSYQSKELIKYNLENNNQVDDVGKPSYASLFKNNSSVAFQPSQSYNGDDQSIQPIQLYKVENQPRVRASGSTSRGKRPGKMSESTRHRKQHQEHRGGVIIINNSGGGKAFPSPVGSGMRAVFLGGSGSRNAPCGTGVFLPRSVADVPDQGRKNKGCSTVLIPTRVLQALEQHFNNMESRPLSPSGTFHPSWTRYNQHGATENMQQGPQPQAPMEPQETELPQEWIY